MTDLRETFLAYRMSFRIRDPNAQIRISGVTDLPLTYTADMDLLTGLRLLWGRDPLWSAYTVGNRELERDRRRQCRRFK
jgi:hypothetical protein